MTATIALTPEPDEIEVLDWVQTYSDAKRLAPSRAHELVEKAMASEMPEPPDADACCGCSCCPCVKDLWREEVAVWKAVRDGGDAEELAAKKSFKKESLAW